MQERTDTSKFIYYRLIALWAVAEGLLGGIIHSFQLPVSGLIVGGFAVICIALIAQTNQQRGAILKATILVAIFKMMLSPQSSIMAYVALFFQGITGELFLGRKKSPVIALYVFTILSLLESASQRILIMTLIYGKQIWMAIDVFINGLTGREEITRYSYMLAAFYILLHVMAALFIAVFIIRIRKLVFKKNRQTDSAFLKIDEEKTGTKKKPIRWFYLSLYMILIVLFLQSSVDPEHAWLPASTTLRLIIRSILILLTWNYLFSPLLKMLLKKWLEKKKQASGSELYAVLELLPSTQLIIRHSWKRSANYSGIFRLNYFLKEVFINALANGRI